jgi:hypothetical protein
MIRLIYEEKLLMVGLSSRNITGSFLILHGLVHGLLTSSPRPDVPGSEAWTLFTAHSWALDGLGTAAAASRLVGIILLILVVAGFVLAGAGELGIGGLADAWRWLALTAACLSLVLMVLFWHPLMGPGVVIDLLIIAALTVEWKYVKSILK